MTQTLPRPEPLVAESLQASLVELLDLSLVAKQAHWNVVGPNFRPLHLELDEITELARTTSDQIAERLAAIGASPDGRPATVVTASGLDAFPAGYLQTATAVDLMTERLERIAAAHRDRIKRFDGGDLVSQGILIAIVEQLDKAAWMLRMQQR